MVGDGTLGENDTEYGTEKGQHVAEGVAMEPFYGGGLLDPRSNIFFTLLRGSIQ